MTDPAALWAAYAAAPGIATRNALVEWYYPLCRAIARGICRRRADDLAQTAVPCLMRLIERFDHRGSFGSYARFRLRGELMDAAAKMRDADSTDAALHARGRIPSPLRLAQMAEFRSLALAKIPQRRDRLIAVLLLDGLAIKTEIAPAVGLSEQAVTLRLRRMRPILRHIAKNCL